MAGVKGKSGGRRDGSGRAKGTPNKVNQDLKGMAQVYTKDALRVLVEIANDDEAPKPARVSAAVAILDRGHGKPTQSLDVDHSANISNLMVQWVQSNGNGESVND